MVRTAAGGSSGNVRLFESSSRFSHRQSATSRMWICDVNTRARQLTGRRVQEWRRQCIIELSEQEEH